LKKDNLRKELAEGEKRHGKVVVPGMESEEEE